MNYFLKNLTFLRGNQSLAQFSRDTNIPYRTLQDIFAKKVNYPKTETLIKLRDHFNILIDELLFTDFSKEGEWYEINNNLWWK